MTKIIKTLRICQSFSNNIVATFIFRKFPKFRGYWIFLRLIVYFLPKSWVIFDVLVDLNGKKFKVPIDLRDPYQIDIFAKEKMELCAPALFTMLTEPGDFYLDVGANAGWYCRFMCLALGANGIVIGMEPSRRVFPFLSNLKYENFIPLPFAATEFNGQILKDDSNPLRQSASSTFGVVKNESNSRASNDKFVIGRSIDHLLLDFKKLPRILKIDVEGAELNVLRGAINSLKEIPYVFIEVNVDERCRKFGYEFLEIYHLMKSMGFHYKYDVKNSNNTIEKLDDEEAIPGDILFSRIEILDLISVK